MQNILRTALSKRFSTKVFNPEKMADSEKIQAIVDTLHLAPSSLNCQPWHVFIITDKQRRAELATTAKAHNQSKFINASHLFVFCRKTDFTAGDIERVVCLTDELRGDGSGTRQREKMQNNILVEKDLGHRQCWMDNQVYLQLGQFLTCCALLELESCPIEGFDAAEMTRLMGLHEQGLEVVVTAVVGIGSEEDYTHCGKGGKVRFDNEEIVTYL